MGKKFFWKLTGQVPHGCQVYQGPYHEGTATYVYRPSSKGHVFEGKFHFEMKFKYGRHLYQGYRRAHGHFSDNRKTGDWLFESRDGMRASRMRATFRRGRLIGTATYESQEERGLNLLVPTQLTFCVSDTHVLEGPIEGIVGGLLFKGGCDDHARAHGVWTITEKVGDAVVSRDVEEWDHGLLQRSYRTDLGGVEMIEQPPYMRQLLNKLFGTIEKTMILMVRRGSHHANLHIFGNR